MRLFIIWPENPVFFVYDMDDSLRAHRYVGRSTADFYPVLKLLDPLVDFAAELILVVRHHAHLAVRTRGNLPSSPRH